MNRIDILWLALYLVLAASAFTLGLTMNQTESNDYLTEKIQQYNDDIQLWQSRYYTCKHDYEVMLSFETDLNVEVEYSQGWE